jgi:hypothetical protein
MAIGQTLTVTSSRRRSLGDRRTVSYLNAHLTRESNPEEQRIDGAGAAQAD